jgi:hypothetical protein
MPKVKLTVITMSGAEFEIETPDDVTIKELIGELTAYLSLPTKGFDGSPIEYRLDSKNLGKRLLENETIANANVTGDSLLLTVVTYAGGGWQRESAGHGTGGKSRISITDSAIGLPLDDLGSVDFRNLLSNEPALMMTLHSYRATLFQLDDSRQELKKAHATIDELLDKLKEKNIATALLILGQIQIGFGTNLITSGSSGGWFVFLAGL